MFRPPLIYRTKEQRLKKHSIRRNDEQVNSDEMKGSPLITVCIFRDDSRRCSLDSSNMRPCSCSRSCSAREVVPTSLTESPVTGDVVGAAVLRVRLREAVGPLVARTVAEPAISPVSLRCRLDLHGAKPTAWGQFTPLCRVEASPADVPVTKLTEELAVALHATSVAYSRLSP